MLSLNSYKNLEEFSHVGILKSLGLTEPFTQKKLLSFLVARDRINIYKLCLSMNLEHHENIRISVNGLLDDLYDTYFGNSSEYWIGLLELNSFSEGVIVLNYESYVFIADRFNKIPIYVTADEAEQSFEFFRRSCSISNYVFNFEKSCVDDFWDWYMREPNDSMYVRSDCSCDAWNSLESMSIFSPYIWEPGVSFSPLNRRNVFRLKKCHLESIHL